MKERIQASLNTLAEVIETLVGVLLLLALFISIAGLVVSMNPTELVEDTQVFSEYLSAAATLVIGAEFVKMLCNHTMGSVLEVMLLVIARQTIVEHTSPAENLLAVLSIGILYVLRKFLYIPRLDRRRYLRLFAGLAHQHQKSKENQKAKEYKEEWYKSPEHFREEDHFQEENHFSDEEHFQEKLDAPNKGESHHTD